MNRIGRTVPVCFAFTAALLCNAAAAAAAPASAEAVFDRILSYDAPSVRAQLRDLPESVRSNFTLVYRSRSLQGASYAAPRALLFTDDARLVATFNGDPDHRGYVQLELMYFDDETSAFEFRAITYAEGEPRSVSRANPRVCQVCHGTDPRPVWHSYGYGGDKVHWPGVYGSIHDTPRLVATEAAALPLFRVDALLHPRYRYLVFSLDSAWAPYGDGPFQHRFRPNNRLGNLLARLNAKRVARLLRMRTSEAPETLVCALLARHDDQLTPAEANLFERAGGDSLWHMNIEGSADVTLFSTGAQSLVELVAQVLLKQVEAPEWTERGCVSDAPAGWEYERFETGYYAKNVEAGGVGAAYNQLVPPMSLSAAAACCPG